MKVPTLLILSVLTWAQSSWGLSSLTGWQRVAIPGQISYLASGNGITVGLGEFMGQAFISSNLTDWAIHPNSHNRQIYALGFANGLFIATAFRTVYVSQDGLNWSAYSTEESGYVITSSRERILLGAWSSVISSTNGATWETKYISRTTGLSGGAFGNGRFVFGSSFAFVSSDAIAWEERWLSNALSIEKISFGRGNFVAIAKRPGGYTADPLMTRASQDPEDRWWVNNAIITSIDGLDWRSTHETTNGILRATLYGNGTFIASGTRGTFLQSTDGASWREEQLGYSIRAIGFANDRFIRVGDRFIEVSNPILTIEAIGQTHLRVFGPAEALVELQTTDNILGTWRSIASQPLQGPEEVLELPSGISNPGFLRALLVQ